MTEADCNEQLEIEVIDLKFKKISIILNMEWFCKTVLAIYKMFIAEHWRISDNCLPGLLNIQS